MYFRFLNGRNWALFIFEFSMVLDRRLNMDEALKNIYRTEYMMLSLPPKKLYKWIISSDFIYTIILKFP